MVRPYGVDSCTRDTTFTNLLELGWKRLTSDDEDGKANFMALDGLGSQTLCGESGPRGNSCLSSTRTFWGFAEYGLISIVVAGSEGSKDKRCRSLVSAQARIHPTRDA